MPYIDEDRRALAAFDPSTPGELNYALTRLCTTYLSRGDRTYQRIAHCIGALECAKLELYRRVAAPYEDVKKERNGDVY